MKTLIAYYDVNDLSEVEFQQFLEDVMELAEARAERRFTPGRPKLAMKFGVRDEELAVVIDQMHAAEDAHGGA